MIINKKVDGYHYFFFFYIKMDFNHSRPTLNVVDWEDENTACYQIEVRGVCVSRRKGKG
jgi:hypothetical protein